LEADRVVIELLAKVDSLERDVKRASTTYEQGMAKIERAATKAEQGSTASLRRASAQISGFSRSMARDMVDVAGILQSPASPFVMPQKQAPMASAAMKGLSFASSALAGVMGGVVVAGVGAAVSALASLIFKSRETGDEVQKLVEKLIENERKARSAAEAQRIFATTSEGAQKAARELTDALDEQNRTLEHNIALKKAGIAGTLQSLTTNLGDTVTRLRDAAVEYANARKALTAAEAASGTGDPSEAQNNVLAARQRLDAARRNVAELRTEVASLTASTEDAARGLRSVDFPLIERNAKEAVDPIAKINREFDDMAKKAKAAGTYTDALAKSIERKREAALKEERDKDRQEKKERAKAPTLPPVTGAEIARALGTSINSGKRTAAQNRAAGGGANSYHLIGQAIDIPLTVNGKPLTKDGIRAALAPLGVEIKELLGPGDKGHDDHFHIAFGKKRLTPDQVASRSDRDAARTAREAERLAAEAARNEEAYLRDLEQLNGRILALREREATDLDTRLALQLAQIEQEQKAADRAVARREAEGEIDAAKAKELVLANQQIADLEAAAARRAANEERNQKAQELRQRELDFQVAGLEYEADMATNRRDHLAIQLQIIDLVFQQRLEQLEVNKALALYAGNIAKAAEIQAEINRVMIEGEQAKGRARRQNESPVQAAARDAADISDELDAVALNSIDMLTAGITDAIMGTKSLKEAFSQMAQSIIKDILAMVVKMLIFKALQRAFGFGLAQGGPVPSGYARGGRIVGPGTGTSDSIPIMASAGEFVIRKQAADKLGAGVLHHINRTGRLPSRHAQGGPIDRIQPTNRPALMAGTASSAAGGAPIVFDMRGAVVTEDLLRQVNLIATTRATQAGKAAFDASRQSMPQRLAEIQRLGG
jgi:uncharacterized protein YcbK (DUF882 family)